MTSDAGKKPELEETQGAVDFEGDPIVGRTELTSADFTAVWAILPQSRSIFVRFALLILLIPLVGLMHWMFNGEDPDTSAYPSWLLVAVLVFVYIATLGFRVWRGRDRWARNAVADVRGSEGVDFRFDSAGFSVRSPGRQFELAWSSLYRSIETAQSFAIYTTPAMVMVVPKRAFSVNDQTRLRAYLMQLVPNRPLRGTDPWRPLVRTVLLWSVLATAFIIIWRVLSSE